MFNVTEHLIKLKDKDYLQVMWRLVWFREEKKNWNIDTQLVRLEDNQAIFVAKISDENGVQKASGYGSESVKDFKDYIEKAETKAIGRALAALGYGTQFAPDLDEGERVVDSPVTREDKSAPPADFEERVQESSKGKGNIRLANQKGCVSREQAIELVRLAKKKWGESAVELFAKYTGYENTLSVLQIDFEKVKQTIESAPEG